MWSSENERKGFQECTPAGYVIYGIAELILVAFYLSALGVAMYVLSSLVQGLLSARRFALLALPAGLLTAGWLLSKTAWYLAERKGFKYDHKENKCTWNGS